MYAKHAPSRWVSTVSVTCVIGIYIAHWAVYCFWCSPTVSNAMLLMFLMGMALWSYAKTSFTDPGTRNTFEWQAWESTRTEEDIARTKASSEEGMRLRHYRPGRATWCSACMRERPERAHHCGQCSFCILRMDHHCPWVGTCIGWRNQKYFVLFLWWTFLTTVHFLLTLQKPSAADGVMALLADASQPVSVVVITCVVGSFVFMLVTGGMFCFQLFMVARNVSGIEEMFVGDNPYCQPSCLDNIRQLFGPLDLRILIPVFPTKPPRLDGTSFPSVACDDSERGGYGSI
mmetsp:Transcript_64631/g.179780  ORF Transcript_64631/g.179780 Transcript_64631/m.179780 type:complete len:288 (-) Transcript_64631:165-1028(-)